MSMTDKLAAVVGNAYVVTTSGRGWNPEELADRAIEKIVYVGQNSHPVIADQAIAFRDAVRQVIVFYLKEAQRSERTTICAELSRQGREDLADIIRSL